MKENNEGDLIINWVEFGTLKRSNNCSHKDERDRFFVRFEKRTNVGCSSKQRERDDNPEKRDRAQEKTKEDQEVKHILYKMRLCQQAAV